MTARLCSITSQCLRSYQVTAGARGSFPVHHCLGWASELASLSIRLPDKKGNLKISLQLISVALIKGPIPSIGLNFNSLLPQQHEMSQQCQISSALWCFTVFTYMIQIVGKPRLFPSPKSSQPMAPSKMTQIVYMVGKWKSYTIYNTSLYYGPCS